MTADAEFLLSKAKYKAITGREQRRDADVLCYQIRQSFKPGEITPEEANRVGYETAMRWTKGKHAFFVATHTDRRHIHSPCLPFRATPKMAQKNGGRAVLTLPPFSGPFSAPLLWLR